MTDLQLRTIHLSWLFRVQISIFTPGHESPQRVFSRGCPFITQGPDTTQGRFGREGGTFSDVFGQKRNTKHVVRGERRFSIMMFDDFCGVVLVRIGTIHVIEGVSDLERLACSETISRCWNL